MNSFSLTPFSSGCSSSTPPKLKPPYAHHYHINVNQKRKLVTDGRCKAALAHEAPFVVAMGASVLNSLVFPLPVGPNDNEDGESMIESADARFAVMGIISFIPYFNWMSWVFAWMDTADNRYALYAAVYLAPYLRSKLSISPNESWLPITSILLSIIHIQLEASIKNGDLQNFPLFKGKKDTTISNEHKLHTSYDELRNKIRNFGIPKKPARKADRLDVEPKKH